jgi:hypothetical protein
MKFVSVIHDNQDLFEKENEDKFIIKESLPQYINPNFNIKEKDDEFTHLQELIEVKKKSLLENQQKIKKIAKQNEFLEHIKNDYANYNQYIIKQKRDQMLALEMLHNYIKDLSESGELSEQNIKDSKQEQKRVLQELKEVKSSLDSLINEDQIHHEPQHQPQHQIQDRKPNIVKTKQTQSISNKIHTKQTV